MGSTMSTELGKTCLFTENRDEVMIIKQRIIDNDPTFTAVDLSNRFLGDNGINSNIDCLIDNTNITMIDLSYNQLTHESLECLLRAIDFLPQLSHLSLSGNDFGSEGCKLLAEFLIEQKRRDEEINKSRTSTDKLQEDPPIYNGLESLSLFHNNLYDKDVVPLVNAVCGNRTKLSYLNLDRNNLTNASWVMFHRAICGLCESDEDKNHFLTSISIGLRPDVAPPDRLIYDVEQQLSLNRIEYERRKYIIQMNRDAEARERENEAIQEKLLREEDEEIRRRLQERVDEIERMKLEEEEELMEFERRMKAMKATRKTREQIEEERQLWVQRAIEQAYDWRNKINRSRREWKDGFTTLVPMEGDSLGTKPTVSVLGSRKLQPCWCDPPNTTAPYAKTLHYHCKHEDLNKASDDGVTAHYDGCRATSHICASVGYYCKAVPDLTAVHFFSSPALNDHPIDESQYTYTV